MHTGHGTCVPELSISKNIEMMTQNLQMRMMEIHKLKSQGLNISITTTLEAQFIIRVLGK